MRPIQFARECSLALISIQSVPAGESIKHMQSHRSPQFAYDVSIVVVSFNTRDVLRECLLSVYREIGSLRVQVIVVDNASTDGSPAMIDREFPRVELLR